MASALVKVHAFSGAWDSVCEAAIAATREGEALGNISAIFAGVVARDASRELVRGAGAARTTHPTDSHPPLNVRLEALGLPLKKVEEHALRVTPADAAISLIETPEAIETALSDAFQAMLARYVDVAPGGSAPDSC